MFSTLECDIWAFGMTFLSLLTGKGPWIQYSEYKDKIERILADISERKHFEAIPKDIPDRVKDILICCLQPYVF